MIIRNGKELDSRYYNNKKVSAIYKGTKLIWSAVSSSFGAGVWTNKYPWKNQDVYRNK